MNLYLKILKFMKPFWRLITISILLTFGYVFFNTISLWISVDFLKELFSPQNVESQKLKTSTTTNSCDLQKEKIKDKDKNFDIYNKVNRAIKSVIIKDDKFDTLRMVCIIIFLSYLLKNIFLYLHETINAYINFKIVVNLRNKLHGVAMYLPLSFFESRHSGKITSIAFNDVKSIKNVLEKSFGKMILSPIQIVTNLLILLLISWKLSLITFTIIPVSGYIIIRIGQSIRRRSRRVFQRISVVMALFQEAISSIRIVKAFTSEEKEIERFHNANNKFFKAQFRAKRLSLATSPLNETFGVLVFSGLLWVGGTLVFRGTELDAEAFVRYLLILFATFQPLKTFSGLNNTIQRGLAAAERVFNVLDYPKEEYDRPGYKVIRRLKNSIEWNHVTFQYNENEPVVLCDINLKINKGEKIAFVGPSGSGKTTLVSLLPRFYDVKEGAIKIDGTDIREIDLRSLRKQIGIVMQENILFNDTVFANISYGAESASERRVIMAAKAANAWDFICNMEKGLYTVVGEKGVKLSGGQKQRISIARAILKNPPILILDEATSSLDAESEMLVQEAIEKLMKNRTVLVIAHRLSTVIHADRIVVMNRGRILDIGSHHSLLEKSPFYRNLYEIQFREPENNKNRNEP